MKVEQLTCAIGAELTGVNLSDAVRDEALFTEIRQALQRSGLFLEARLAATAQGDPAQRPATGTLTAPPRVVPQWPPRD